MFRGSESVIPANESQNRSGSAGIPGIPAGNNNLVSNTYISIIDRQPSHKSSHHPSAIGGDVVQTIIVAADDRMAKKRRWKIEDDEASPSFGQ